MGATPPPLLVRVKRAREAEPLPQLLVEEPATSSRAEGAKRQRPSAAAASLRLLDSVPCSSDDAFEDGLPPSWIRAVSEAEFRNWAASSGNAEPTATVENRPAVAFHETCRRTICAGLHISPGGGGSVSLIDLEPAAPPPPSRAPPPFLVDGQALFVVDSD